MKKIIYRLVHDMKYSATDSDRKFVGSYTSLANAIAARSRTQVKPGFADPRGSFVVHACQIDHTYWPGGVDAAPTIADSAVTSDHAPTMLENIYSLANVNEDSLSEEREYTLGVYSTREAASMAEARLRDIPELAAPGREFSISRYPVDTDFWTDGFIAGE